MSKVANKPSDVLHRTGRADSLACIAEGLATRIPSIKGRVPEVVLALHEILDGADKVSIEARMKVQMHLVQVSNELLTGIPPKDELLSTEQAALMMKCSRPYVAMLVDRNRLPGAVKTPGGHRKIPKSSILAWMDSNPPAKDGGADYKAAAREAGMYDIPEETYVKAPSRSKNETAGG